MALIDCPECWRLDSHTALSCPHYGYPLKAKQTDQTMGKSALIVVGLLLAAVLIMVVPALFYFRALVFVCLIGALVAMIFPQIKKLLK